MALSESGVSATFPALIATASAVLMPTTIRITTIEDAAHMTLWPKLAKFLPSRQVFPETRLVPRARPQSSRIGGPACGAGGHPPQWAGRCGYCEPKIAI